jgi:hypothetical protein
MSEVCGLMEQWKDIVKSRRKEKQKESKVNPLIEK